MKTYLLTGTEGRNMNRLPDLPDVLQENKPVHSGPLYRRYLTHTGMLLTVTTGNRLNNGYELLCRQADATSAGHLLRRIAGSQKEADAPSVYLAWYELRPLHPEADRENHKLRLIDNIRYVPIPGMSDFDIKAIRSPVY
jgi:hypothetical protein